MPIQSEQIIDYPDLGNVTFIRKSGISRISIRVNMTNGIRVTYPYQAKFKDAQNFLNSKSDWLKKSLQKVNNQKKQSEYFTNLSDIKTLGREVVIRPQFSDKIKINKKTEQIVIEYPIDWDIQKKENQQTISRFKRKVLIDEARIVLSEKLRLLANKFQLQYKSITIRDTRSRWGSCSSDNKISLNYRLICIPEELCDYVLLHELAHIKYKNHGTEFWRYLTIMDFRTPELNKELKKYALQ